jgi:hypothetical protein
MHAESGAGSVGYVEAQIVLQYQRPRSHTHRLPASSHCDSPAVLQAVPMVGSDATVSHTGTGVVPPVALPPVPEPLPPTPPSLSSAGTGGQPTTPSAKAAPTSKLRTIRSSVVAPVPRYYWQSGQRDSIAKQKDPKPQTQGLPIKHLQRVEP